jgi:DNA-binding NarL/FixJ family response regulator
MTALLREAGLTVIGEGETWQDAERLAPTSHVVVLDLWMPSLDIGALQRVRAAAPDALLVVITALGPEDAAEKCEGVELDLLLSKSHAPDLVAAAIAGHAHERFAQSVDGA